MYFALLVACPSLLEISTCLAGATAHVSGGRRPALGLTHRLEQQLDHVGGRQLDEEVEEHGGGLG